VSVRLPAGAGASLWSTSGFADDGTGRLEPVHLSSQVSTLFLGPRQLIVQLCLGVVEVSQSSLTLLLDGLQLSLTTHTITSINQSIKVICNARNVGRAQARI